MSGSNDVLEEYLARLRIALASRPEEERDAIVAEARAHIEEAVAARLADAPGASRDAITLQETHAFGEPEEIAAPYDPQGAPRARLTGGKPWMLWAGVGLVAVLVLVFAIDALQPTPDGFAPYARSNVGLFNHTGVINETFEVPLDAIDLTLDVDVRQDPGDPLGCAGVRITSASGTVVLDEWDACGNMDHTLSFSRPGERGDAGLWRIEIQYRDFSGDLSIDSEGHTP